MTTKTKPTKAAKTKAAVKSVVVAFDEATGAEACYVDGLFKQANDTIYAHDIVTAVGGESQPFTLRQINFDDVPGRKWPETLEELQRIGVVE